MHTNRIAEALLKKWKLLVVLHADRLDGRKGALAGLLVRRVNMTMKFWRDSESDGSAGGRLGSVSKLEVLVIDFPLIGPVLPLFESEVQLLASLKQLTVDTTQL